MKKINLLLLCSILSILFTGCSKNIFIDRSQTFMKIKTNETFIKLKNIKYKDLPKNHFCIKKAFNIHTDLFSKYGLLQIEHSELNDRCNRNKTIDEVIELMISKLNVKTKYKLLENLTVGDFRFYTFKINKDSVLTSSIDKGPIFRIIAIKGPNKGLTLIRDYFGIFYDELKNTLTNNKPYKKTLFLGKLTKNQNIKILKFDTTFVGIINGNDKNDIFFGFIENNTLKTSSSKNINFIGTLQGNTIESNISMNNGKVYKSILSSQGKTEKTLIDLFFETKGELSFTLDTQNGKSTSSSNGFNFYKNFKGTLSPKDKNGIEKFDLEILIADDVCIAMIDFNHPKNKDIPIFIKTNCLREDNKIECVFYGTGKNQKSMGTDLEIAIKGLISNNEVSGTYESTTNETFKNKFHGTFYAKSTNVSNLTKNLNISYDTYNKDGIHKGTKTKYDYNGYDRDGYDKNGFNMSGENKYTMTKFDTDGYDILGYNEEGYDKNGHDRKGFNSKGIHKETHTEYNELGYDIYGFNKKGFNKYGDKAYTGKKINAKSEEDCIKKGGEPGWDIRKYKFICKDIYNKEGFDELGIHRSTKTNYNPDGFNNHGFNVNKIHKTTKTKYNPNGFDINGYDKDGYDINGLDKLNIDRNGVFCGNPKAKTKFNKIKKRHECYIP